MPEKEGAVSFMAVTPEEAMRLIKEKEGLVIVDTRTGWERKGGWIEGSVHISYLDFLFGSPEDKMDKAAPVLMICAHGARSYRVGKALFRGGWREVYDLEGGMKAWTTAGYPIVRPEEE